MSSLHLSARGSTLACQDCTHMPQDCQVPRSCFSYLTLQAVRTFTCPTFFFFHVGNTFESADGSSLHVDIAAYDDPQILLDFGLDNLLRPKVDAAGRLQQQVSRSSYRRLTIPLQGQSGSRLQVGAGL